MLSQVVDKGKHCFFIGRTVELSLTLINIIGMDDDICDFWQFLFPNGKRKN